MFLQNISDGVTLDGTIAKSRDELEPAEKEIEKISPKPLDETVCGFTVDLPEEIAELHDALFETSRQTRLEDERFEAMLRRVLKPAGIAVTKPNKSLSPRRSPAGPSRNSASAVESEAELIERKIELARQEDHQFEMFLKRVLHEA